MAARRCIVCGMERPRDGLPGDGSIEGVWLCSETCRLIRARPGTAGLCLDGRSRLLPTALRPVRYAETVQVEQLGLL